MVLDTDTLGFSPVLLAMARRVGQSEDGAAHDVAERIAVVVLDVQLAHGVIARSFHDATARVLGEPVVTEEVVQLFQRGVIAQPLCHMFTSY